MNNEIDLNQVSYSEKQLFFSSGATLDYTFRITQLNALKVAMKERESSIIEALHADFQKPAFETYMTEIGFLYDEINHAIKHLKKWMRPQRTRGRLALFPTRYEVHSVPKGIVFIVGPWNYPFQLALSPLVGAIAAGNCALVKASNATQNISKLIAEMLSATFEAKYISAVEGPGSQVVPAILEKWRFDHVFFTGSPAVGQDIGIAAASKHSPFTLELGGKSPAIVDASADIAMAAKRIAWAKCLNAGQTCIAPDYVLAHNSIKDRFTDEYKKAAITMFGYDPEKSPDFARVINKKRFDILSSYLNDEKILFGGSTNAEQRFIEPSLLDEPSLDSAVMSEEIFGPVLPIITYQNLDEAKNIIERNPFPLALYLFTQNSSVQDFFFQRIRFGGGCLNNAIIHLADPRVPFGGVGPSGVGAYHGKKSFDTFSHEKTLAISSKLTKMGLVTAPYTNKKFKLLRFFMK